MPTPFDSSRARGVIISTSLMHVVSLSLYFMFCKMYIHHAPKKRSNVARAAIGSLTAAIVFDLLQFVFLLLSVFHGYGHPSASLSREDSTLAQKYLWISQPLYIWSLSCVKIGIACLLLLIPCYDKKKAKMWPIFLGCTIFFQIAISGVISGLQFSTCKPLRAIWDRTVENPKCRAIGETQTSIYINMAMIIFTDLMLAGLPLAFLSVKGRREKGEICIIVVLLLLTSGVTIYKITLVPNYSVEDDILVEGHLLTILSNLEMHLAIIGASGPCLMVRVLRWMGILSKSAGCASCSAEHYQSAEQVENEPNTAQQASPLEMTVIQPV